MLEHAHVRVTTAATVICALAVAFVGYAWAGNDREIVDLKVLVEKNAEHIALLSATVQRQTFLVDSLEGTVETAGSMAGGNREALIRIEEQLKQINRQVQRIDPQG